MVKIRKKPRDYHNHLRLVEETMSGVMNKTDEAGTPESQFSHVPVTFLCPEGFVPAAFIITAIDRNGQHFTNAPTAQPHLTLRLATLALDYASQHAVLYMQKHIMENKSSIVTVPPGTTLPEWKGPEGRS